MLGLSTMVCALGLPLQDLPLLGGAGGVRIPCVVALHTVPNTPTKFFAPPTVSASFFPRSPSPSLPLSLSLLLLRSLGVHVCVCWMGSLL